MEKFKRLQDYLNNQSPLYLKDWEDFKSSGNLEQDILLILQAIKERKYDTLEFGTDDIVTRFNSSFRTLKELHRLLTFYLKRPIAVEELYTALYNLISKREIVSWICEQINKRIYSVHNYHGYGYGFASEDVDEFGSEFRKDLGLDPEPFLNPSTYGTNYTRKNLKSYEDY